MRKNFVAAALLERYCLVFLFVLALIFVFGFSAYGFYTSDQTEQINTVLHFFDNQLYQKDFEMQHISPIAVKVIPHLLLFTVAKITFIPVAYIYFLAYIATVFFTFYFIYKISFELTAKRHVGLFACLLLLLLRDYHPLSSFMVFAQGFVPYFAAVPIALLCLYLMLKKRHLHSVAICGLLFYVHPQISVFIFLAILTPIVFHKRGPELLKKSLPIYILIVLPPLLSLVLAFSPLAQPVPQYSITELSMFRVPHHIFPPYENIFLHAVLAFFIIALLAANKPKKEFICWNYALLAITALGVLFTRFIPVEFAMLSYPFRVEVFLVISFAILASNALFNLIGGIRSALSKKSIKHISLCRLLVFFLAVVFALSLISIPDFKQPRIDQPKTPFTDIADYARLHTPKYSLFLTPPYLQGFRLYSERSTVVDVKSHPIGRGSRIQDEWFNRLLTLCHTTEFKSPGLKIEKECRYDSLTRAEYLSLCKKYNADYFVTDKNDKTMQWGDLLIYNNPEFALFNCQENT